MKKLLVLAVAACASVASAQYWLNDFGFVFSSAVGGSGTNDGVTMVITGGDIGLAGDSEFQGLAPNTGLLTFDWTYSSIDYGDFDQGYYDVNGGRTVLCNNDGPFAGSVSTGLSAGDALDIGVYTFDGVYGPGILTVTNFNLTPEPASLALVAVGLLLRRR